MIEAIEDIREKHRTHEGWCQTCVCLEHIATLQARVGELEVMILRLDEIAEGFKGWEDEKGETAPYDEWRFAVKTIREAREGEKS